MIKWKYTGDTKIYTGLKKIPPEKAVKIFVFPIAFFCIMCYNTAMNKKTGHMKKTVLQFIKISEVSINT